MKWEDIEDKPVHEKKRCGKWELEIDDNQFYLHTTDLLLSPYGMGSSLKGAMESFLQHVAEYRKVLDECEKYIQEELKNATTEI